jgi:hypothetical protein
MAAGMNDSDFSPVQSGQAGSVSAGGVSAGGVSAGGVPAWAGRMRAMTGRIDGFFRPLEAVFLSTGERLQELYGSVSRLSDNIGAAGALFSSAEMSEILAGLAESARHIDAMRQQRGGLAATLGQMIATTGAMTGSLNTLGRIMAQAQVLAVNAKIEASQLVRTGNDFTVFTRDIARLAKTGEQTIGAVRQELNSLRAAATKAQALQHEFETRQLPELDAIADRLAVSVRSLEDSRERAERGARDIPERLRVLFGHISSLVSNLQVYDATRQRLEHVEQALATAAGMIEADGHSGMDTRQQRVFVNGIAELQSLQLVHAGEHYHQSLDDIGDSIAALAREVPAVADVCRQAFVGSDVDSLLDIDRSLEKASQVFADFIAIRQQAAGSLEHVVQAAARARELMRQLNSVNGDMRLMGLNAGIKCGNMGTIGRALSVIAQELQGYAALTREHVDIIAGHLGQISSSAESIVSADKADTDHIDAESLKSQIDCVVVSLGRTSEGLSLIMGGIETLSSSVVSQARTAQDGFAGKVDCRHAMADQERELKALADDSHTGLAGAALEEARREVLAFTETQYTMASERSVHGTAVDGRHAAGRPANAAATARPAGDGEEPDIDGLLF